MHFLIIGVDLEDFLQSTFFRGSPALARGPDAFIGVRFLWVVGVTRGHQVKGLLGSSTVGW